VAPRTKGWDRRQLLLGGAPGATAAVVLAACSPRSPKQISYAPTFFSSGEWSFVNAAVRRLIPSEGEGPGAFEAGVPEFIDRQMELPYGHGSYFYMSGPFLSDLDPTLGYQLRFVPREIYRYGIASANQYCRERHGRNFSDLSATNQDTILQSMEDGKCSFLPVSSSVFFGQLLGNTHEGYFSDPLYGGNRNMTAWTWIGFPGARADFTDWMDRAGAKYPYGPVSISGETA